MKTLSFYRGAFLIKVIERRVNLIHSLGQRTLKRMFLTLFSAVGTAVGIFILCVALYSKELEMNISFTQFLILSLIVTVVVTLMVWILGTWFDVTTTQRGMEGMQGV